MYWGVSVGEGGKRSGLSRGGGSSLVLGVAKFSFAHYVIYKEVGLLMQSA